MFCGESYLVQSLLCPLQFLAVSGVDRGSQYVLFFQLGRRLRLCVTCALRQRVVACSLAVKKLAG